RSSPLHPASTAGSSNTSRPAKRAAVRDGYTGEAPANLPPRAGGLAVAGVPQVGLDGEALDEPDLVAGLVVDHFVHQPPGHQHAEAALAQPERLADHHVGDRVVGLGGVGQVLGVEPRPGVADGDRDLVRVDVVQHGDDTIDLLLVPPLDGVDAHLAD